MNSGEIMRAKPTKEEAAREIAEECREAYEEIRLLQKHFGWSLEKLCEKAGVEMYDDEELDDEKATFKKLHDQVKKMFQRKTWEHNKATGKTLAHMTHLRNAIYRTDDYRRSKFYQSTLPPKLREAMRRESKELRKWLTKTDYEE